jgi:hypothetical protein
MTPEISPIRYKALTDTTVTCTLCALFTAILLLLCFKCGINDLRHGDDSLILLTLPYKLQCDGCVFESLRGIV